MDFEPLRIGGVGFIQPTSQSLPARVAVVLPLSARSLSIEPTLSNANYVAVIPSPGALCLGPLREQVERVRPGSNLLQAQAIEWALSAEGRLVPRVSLHIQSPRLLTWNWLVFTSRT